MKNDLRVGYDRLVLTPEESIPLTGFGNEAQRFHKAVTEDICVTCVAVTDDADTTILLVGMDFVHISDEIGETVRQRLSAATGVPEDRIYVAGTHTHSGPAVHFPDYPQIRRYAEMCWQKAEQAAVQAMADRKPARMLVGSIETHNLNFIKHYKVRDNETGEISYIGDLFGTEKGKTILDHATKVDPTLHMVQFAREGGKDVVMANFRAHPHFTGGIKKYDLSSDYIGAFRMALEAMADCHAVYFQGAGGNVNSSTRLAGERRFTTCRSHGTALAAYALECMGKHMAPVEAARIKTAQQVFKADLYVAPKELVAPSEIIWKAWKAEYDQQKCIEMGKPYGIRSQYHAFSILRSQGFTPERGYLTLNAVSIGEKFAFVTYPGELFDTISVRMEENSPYTTTMLLGYCHHHTYYLPSMPAFKYTSYETDCTFFQPGTGEKVADAFVAMLKNLKSEA